MSSKKNFDHLKGSSDLINFLMKSIKPIHSSLPGFQEIKAANEIINSSVFDYNKLSYFYSTQNQRYIRQVAPQKLESAFIITGPGDSVLELANLGAKRIVTADTNPFQTLIFKLRRAAVLTLSAKDFKKFMIDRDCPQFLSREVFETVKAGFGNDEAARNFWEYTFINDPDDLLRHFFRPVAADTATIEYGIPYLKNKPDFYALKDKLERVNIMTVTADAIDYLTDTTESFDYIDISNILLFIYQMRCQNNQEAYCTLLQSLRKIYEERLQNGGSFVLDYLFAISAQDVLAANPDATISKEGLEIYRATLTILQDLFSIEYLPVEKIQHLSLTASDTVVYTKK